MAGLSQHERLRRSVIGLRQLGVNGGSAPAIDALRSVVRQEVVSLTWLEVMSVVERLTLKRNQTPARWLHGKLLHDVINPQLAYALLDSARATSPYEDGDAFVGELAIRLKQDSVLEFGQLAAAAGGIKLGDRLNAVIFYDAW